MHPTRIPAWATERGRRLNYFPAIDPKTTALIVIDLQNAFMVDGQPMANSNARAIVPKVNRIAATLRAAGGRIVWTRHTIAIDGPFAQPAWQVAAWGSDTAVTRALTAGSIGHALYAELDVAPDDPVIDKYRYSAFNRKSSDLDAILESHGIDTLIIVGTMTNVCCESTARDSHMLDYKVLVVSDATAAPTDEEHDAALLNLSMFFAHVAESDEIVRIVGGDSPPKLPVIDLAPLTAGEVAGREAVADRIRAACIENGFFYVVGHGVPSESTDGVFGECRRLFGLDDDAKRAISAASPSGRGYGRMSGGSAGAKEEYYLGGDGPNDVERNRWPEHLPGFRETMEAYLAAMHMLARRLTGAIALSLDLPEDYFAEFCKNPIAALRLVRYPPEGATAGTHTDFGALTLLLQDTTGGLQVYDRATKGWIDAPPIPGSFVVNLGDLFERWTNKRYRSTPHRVIHPPGVERFSAPFFFTGAPNYSVACLPACLDDGEQPAYPPTTPAAHLRERTLRQGF
jgi:isopenicillin N synthase-like dioxygenase/nicotinamidase-related amidase